ncbi:uncharacterized protein LOC132930041 [Rhopalosiphum padi]|uniref:uncharacterized protein LOC132930041 n=1 Tax=Rhopalosiphum padi TaxID=40932 RepID=UPI00298D724F|nr:uncharacterized protein LOC132930041 [Rhopalosiphum padi]
MIFKDYMDLVLLEKIKSESTEPLLIPKLVNDDKSLIQDIHIRTYIQLFYKENVIAPGIQVETELLTPKGYCIKLKKRKLSIPDEQRKPKKPKGINIGSKTISPEGESQRPLDTIAAMYTNNRACERKTTILI